MPSATATIRSRSISPSRAAWRITTVRSSRRSSPTELYLGSAKGPGKQLKYADQYDIPLAILYGSQEKEQGIVTIKDLVAGRERAQATADRKEYLGQRAGQVTAPRTELVSTIRSMLAAVE